MSENHPSRQAALLSGLGRTQGCVAYISGTKALQEHCASKGGRGNGGGGGKGGKLLDKCTLLM